MYITENIQTHLDKNELTAGVFINMRRAFDTVDNDILLTNWTTMELGGCLVIGSAHT